MSWEDTVDPSGCNTDDPINYWQASRDPARTPFQWNSEKNAGLFTNFMFSVSILELEYYPHISLSAVIIRHYDIKVKK